MMASTPLPAYGVHVRSFYIRKHFKDCTSRSFPDDWTHLENVMLLLPRFKIVSLSTCAREVALANAHPGPFPQISFWRTGLPIHTGTLLTRETDTCSEATQEKDIDLYPLLRALLRCLDELPWRIDLPRCAARRVRLSCSPAKRHCMFRQNPAFKQVFHTL